VSQRMWIIVGVVAILLIGLCMCAAAAAVLVGGIGGFSFMGRAEVTEDLTTEFELDTPGRLIVDNDVGEVNIRAVDGNVVRVDVTKRVRGRSGAAASRLLDQITVTTDSAGGEGEIRVDVPGGLEAASASVELDIRVPRQVTLDVNNRVGAVTVSGTQGALQVFLGVGEIKADDVRLLGDSRLETNVGEIGFSGRLPDSGLVAISTRTGDIALKLPADSTFIIDAQTGVGEIDNEFTLEARETAEADTIVSRTLRGRVGANPGVTLQLETGTGSIKIEH
jgi:DUF4097 and DUF4098 domain-containing protein YvlB